jgi:hypothetical protein
MEAGKNGGGPDLPGVAPGAGDVAPTGAATDWDARGSDTGLHPEEDLTEFDGLGVLDEDLPHHP